MISASGNSLSFFLTVFWVVCLCVRLYLSWRTDSDCIGRIRREIQDSFRGSNCHGETVLSVPISYTKAYTRSDAGGPEQLQKSSITIGNALHSKHALLQYLRQRNGILPRHLPFQRGDAMPMRIDLRMSKFSRYALLKAL